MDHRSKHGRRSLRFDRAFHVPPSLLVDPPIYLQIGKCRTKNFKYVGANELVGPQEHNPKRARYFEQQVDVQRDLEEFYQMPSDVAEHLSHFYGYRAFEVAELAKKRGPARLHESLPYLEVEVPYCVQQEMAVRLSDVIMRRLRIGVTDTWLTMQCLPKCTILMKNELGWDRNRCYEVVDGMGTYFCRNWKTLSTKSTSVRSRSMM